jgi:diguanylate cyclase (GGDEF)-like protein
MKRKLRLRRSNPELKGQVLREAVTGLFNKSYFDATIREQINRTKRYGGGFILIRVDFDNFKVLNEMYGSLHGMGVLKEFAVLLGNSIRPSDLLISYGNEKFLLVVQGASEMGSNVLLERMTRNLMKWNKEYGCEDYQLTFSYGTAIFDGTRDLTAVSEEADSELHKNKESSNTRLGISKAESFP